MASSSSRSSRASTGGLRPGNHLHHHHPTCHHHSPHTAFASSSSSFSARSSSILHRSASPTRVNVIAGASRSAVRFSLDAHSVSPHRHHLAVSPAAKPSSSAASHHKPARRTCMCSPTTHPGSFRCALHKNAGIHSNAFPSQSNRLHARRSAMTNSLVRIGTVEGDLVKRALAALIRPSSHQQRRRAAFQPRPSRLSVMSTAADE